MNGESIRVVVVDDHEVLRAGLRYVLNPHGIEVVGDTGDTASVRTLIREARPDVVIADVRIGDADGTDLIKDILRAGAKVVIYSGFQDERLLARALAAGALGYVLKDAPVNELIAAVSSVAEGHTWISPALQIYPVAMTQRPKLALLSRREREILGLLSQGRSTDDVADELSLSAHTVRTHVKNAMRKLEASTRAHAVAIALRELSIR